MPIRLYVAVLPGVLDSALGTALDVPAAANRLLKEAGRRPAFDIRPVASASGPLTLGSGLKLSGLGRFEPCGARDLIVVPGADRVSPDELLRWLETPALRKAVGWLRDGHSAGSEIYAGCTGTFVAAEAGALQGARATTTWWLAPTFGQRYPDVSLDLRKVVVDSGSVITAGAAFAHADLMLALMARHVSVDLVRQITRYLLLDGRRVRSSYPLLGRLTHDDTFTIQAERWVHENMGIPFTAETWAEALHTSTRTLARRIRTRTGLTPLQFVQRVRMSRAIQLLESSSAPIEAIALQVGYADSTALRRLIRRELGTSPRDVRAAQATVDARPLSVRKR